MLRIWQLVGYSGRSDVFHVSGTPKIPPNLLIALRPSRSHVRAARVMAMRGRRDAKRKGADLSAMAFKRSMPRPPIASLFADAALVAPPSASGSG